MEDVKATEIVNAGTVEELQRQVAGLMADNTARSEKLATDFGLGLQPSDLVQMRLNSLLSVILNEESRLRVEVLTQATLAVALDNALTEGAKRKQAMDEAEVRQKTVSTLLSGVPGVDPNIPINVPTA